ncbi:zinc-binding loop region of homing endonuclease, partial [Colletotrichum phormii]
LYRHQLAIIAKGQSYALKQTSGKDAQYQVSHLCHQGGCFNPAHIIVEERELNRVRNTCQYKYKIQLPGGTIIDP